MRIAWKRWLAVAAVMVAATCGTARPARALEIPVDQKPFEQLSDKEISEDGKIALSIRPEAWLHGEIPHFVLHYRRITEARRLAIEIEYQLVYVAKVLGAGQERYAQKSHVYIFEDEKDWKTFLDQTKAPPWANSFAHGTELYLNVREGKTGLFDSQTLAHETTHAVVARLYRGHRWPHWLNEGFAEQMSGAATSARMGQYNQRLMQHFQVATLPLDKLVTTVDYPKDLDAVHQFYQSSEKLIRFLMMQNPPERFPKLVDLLVVQGEPFDTAVIKIYGDKYKDYAAFAAAFAKVPN